MIDDLNRRFETQLEKLVLEVERLHRTNPLESASVTSGRVRFIGGTLRVDSGGRVEIVGTLEIDGTTTVTGSFTVTGPWEIAGDGSITGNLTITGPVTIAGNVTATGKWTQNGDWEFNGPGKITGDVQQTGNTDQKGTVTVNGGGKVVVTGGGGNVTLDSSFGAPRIQLGSTQIDGGTSFVFTHSSGVVYFGNNTIRVAGIRTKLKSAVPGSFVGAIGSDPDGSFYRVIDG